MTRQSESSGMRDSLSINEENVGLLSDLFRDPYEERSFSEPEKTRNILGRHTIDRCRGLNNLHVSRVPDGSSDKGSVEVPIVGRDEASAVGVRTLRSVESNSLSDQWRTRSEREAGRRWNAAGRADENVL